MKIAFLHPDLGIGGAERLIVDAVVGLQDTGASVQVYTSHCDKTHCFEEVSSGVVKTTVYGDFFPTNLLGKLHIFFAIVRQLYLTLVLIATRRVLEYDYFIVDQLSFAVPLLRLFCRADAQVLFYCHFPDQLLSKKGGIVKTLYRKPFDAIEEWTTGVSDKLAVNSSFTRGIFHKTFTRLSAEPSIIYPCVDVTGAVYTPERRDAELDEFLKGTKFFLSLNRFERAKNVALAIKAFAEFKKTTDENVRLVVAGGFDARVRENVEHLKELEALCEQLQLRSFVIRGKLVVLPPSTQVLFLPSVSTPLKNKLLKAAELLLYTPGFEHFGIVPVESMLQGTPVLAVNRGGPLETIVSYDGTNGANATGYTCEPNVSLWAEILTRHFNLPHETKQRLGANGVPHVQKNFSREKMTEQFLESLKSPHTNEKDALFRALTHWKEAVGVWAVLLAILAVAVRS